MQPNFCKTLWSSFALLLLCSTHFTHAQVFKWIGPDGKVNYGDRPAKPPSQAEKKSITNNIVENSALPFALAEAKKNAPVTLYTSQKCAACDEGRKLLSARGIPFLEKTVNTNADIASFGGTQVELPQLTIGSARLSGFDSAVWQARLSAVGYPESNKLPRNYLNPPAVSASPAVVQKTDLGQGNSANNSSPGQSNEKTSERTATASKAARSTPTKSDDAVLPGLRF